MSKIGHHGYGVVLNITEIEANIHAWSHPVILVAALRKALKDIRFTAQEFHEAHYSLANFADPAQEALHVITSGNEDLILNGVCLNLNLIN